MSLTTRQWLLHFYYNTIYSYCLYKLNPPSDQKTRQSASLQMTHLLRNTVTSSSLCGIPHYLNHTNTRRARCAPNKHYEIPFVRGMPCSSLHLIKLRTPQGYIASQVTTHSRISDDCIAPTTCDIIKTTKEEPLTSASVRLTSEE